MMTMTRRKTGATKAAAGTVVSAGHVGAMNEGAAPLTTREETVLRALHKLCKSYERRESGGFDADDVGTHARMQSDECQDTLHELCELKLVEQMWPDDNDPWPSHWSITPEGKEVVA